VIRTVIVAGITYTFDAKSLSSYACISACGRSAIVARTASREALNFCTPSLVNRSVTVVQIDTCFLQIVEYLDSLVSTPTDRLTVHKSMLPEGFDGSERHGVHRVWPD